jgi:hypothetical protein
MPASSTAYGTTAPSAIDPFPIESVLAKIVGENNPANAQNMLNTYQVENQTSQGNYNYNLQQQHEFAKQQLAQQLKEHYITAAQQGVQHAGGLDVLYGQGGEAALPGYGSGAYDSIRTGLANARDADILGKVTGAAKSGVEAGAPVDLPTLYRLSGGGITNLTTPLSTANTILKAQLEAANAGTKGQPTFQSAPQNSLGGGSLSGIRMLPGETVPDFADRMRRDFNIDIPVPVPRPGAGPGTNLQPNPAGQAAPTGQSASVAPPAEYMPYYLEASARTGIPVDLLIAQGNQESGFRMDKPGLAGEVGIHQIKPSTASDPGNMPGIDPRTLHDPRVNINFAADYLKSRVGPNADFSNPATVAAALRAYNGGGDPNYIANVNRYRTARVSQPTPASAAGPRTALTALPNNPNAPIASPTANSPPSSPMPPAVSGAQAAPAPAAPAAPAPAPAPSPGPVVQRSAQGGSAAQTAANEWVENKLRLAEPGGEDAYKDIMANAVNGNVTLKQTPGGLRIIGKSGKEYN